MLIRQDDSVLLLIDLQEKLLPAIHDASAVLGHAVWLNRLARRLGVPVMMSEQYPRGLGRTVAPLVEEVPQEDVADKVAFSCSAGGCFADHPGMGRRQVVVAGIEAHVCVMQTVMDLLAAGKQVFVVADAIGSRDPYSRELAIARMREAGAVLVHREMVLFEWLRSAGNAEFKGVSRDFLQ